MDTLSIEKPSVSPRNNQKRHNNAELRAAHGLLWAIVIGGII